MSPSISTAAGTFRVNWEVHCSRQQNTLLSAADIHRTLVTFNCDFVSCVFFIVEVTATMKVSASFLPQ